MHYICIVMTKENKRAVEILGSLKKQGFNFSYQCIANYFEDHGINKKDGIPYSREDVSNFLRKDATDKNIIDAVNKIEADFKKGLKRIWKYHKRAGRPGV